MEADLDDFGKPGNAGLCPRKNLLTASTGLGPVLCSPPELSANAAPGTGLEWTPGGGEAGEIRMFNHWATGLRSGLLPQDCEVATQKWPPKGAILGEVFARVLIFGARG